MNIERREELISAYLDGELGPEERAQVETWLTESPELRQLHDELAALGGRLRSLPRHQLDHDLGGSVLRRAERAVLGGQAAPQAVPEARPSLPISSWWSRGAGWRRLTWPAVALAAALLILVFNSDERAPERQVAQAPKGQTSIAAREPAASGARPADEEPRAGEAADKAESAARLGAKLEKSDDAPALMRKLSPSAAPAVAPAAAAAGNVPRSAGSAGLAQQIAAGRQQGLAVIVCDVTPEYLNDKSFEKLLGKLKVEFSGDELPRSKLLAAAKEAKDHAEAAAADLFRLGADSKGLRQSYTVHATDEQVAQIIAELRKESKQVKKLTDLQARNNELPAVEVDTARVTRRRFVLQAPAAEAAAPAESETKP